MKRNRMFLFLLVVAAVALAGCGQKTTIEDAVSQSAGVGLATEAPKSEAAQNEDTPSEDLANVGDSSGGAESEPPAEEVRSKELQSGQAPDKEPASEPARNVMQQNDKPLPATTPLRVALPAYTDEKEAEQEAYIEAIRQNMQASYAKVETAAFPRYDFRDVESVKQAAAKLKREEAPDVFVLSANSARLFDEFGAILHLEEVALHEITKFDDLLYRSARQATRWHGHILGVPSTLEPVMILYNKSHFAEAGVAPDPNWDWADFVKTSRQVSAGAREVFSQADQEGKRIPRGALDVKAAGEVCTTFSMCWLPILLSNGGGYLQPDQETILVDSQASIDALSWLQSQYEQGTLQGFTSHRISSNLTIASFGPQTLSLLYSLNAEKDLYGALPFPKSPYTGKSVTTVGSTMYVVNAHSQNIDVAVDFVLAALSRQAQELVATKSGRIAARRDVRLPSVSWYPPKDVMDRVLDNAVAALPDQVGYRWVRANMAPLSLGRESAESFAKKAAADLKAIIAQKDNPQKFQKRDTSTSWFGSATTSVKLKTDQDPPPPGFTGVKVRWLSGSRNEVVPLIDAFNKNATETGIYVDFLQDQELDGYTLEGYFRKSIREGNPVELVGSIGGSLSELVEQELLEPLDHYLRFNLAAIPDGGILSQARYKGKLYEVPLFRVPYLVFARKTAWERAGFAYPVHGWSWEAFRRWTQEATAPERAQAGVAFSRYGWDTFFYQMGGRFATGPYEPLEAVLPLVKDLMASYPEEYWVNVGGQQPSLVDLVSGRAIAFIGPLDLYSLRHSASLNYPLDAILDKAGLVALPLPTVSGGLSGAGNYTGVVRVLKDAPYKNEAIKFIQWVLSAEASPFLTYMESGRFPVALYPEAYQSLQVYLGPQVKSILPVQFTSSSEENLYTGTLRKAAHYYVDQYLAGEVGLSETVANIGEQLPLIANGMEWRGQD